MESEDLRVLIITLVTGLLIVGSGAVLLFFAFRAFGEERRGERKFVGLSIALLAFIFACCAVFFMMTMR